VASLGGPVTQGPNRPAVRLIAHVADPLIALALGAGGLTTLLVLWLLVPRGIRRRKKDDEEFEFYHEPPKVPWWTMVILWLFVLLPFAAIGYLLWEGGVRSRVSAVISHAPSLLAPGRHPLRLPPSGEAASQMWTGAVTFLALATALGSLAFMLWILFGDRLAWWWAGPVPAAPRHALAHVVEESLDDLAREPDARSAIIKCYRRFEQFLARSRLPRAPWQTPTEFMREALARLALPEEPVTRLTDLFELARFSNHPLTERNRLSALEALGETRAALAQETIDAGTRA
jgi:hypothetical protein